MLRLSGLSVSYGGLHALADIALEVGEGEFVTIVGPNGAGKTTLLKAIGGADRVPRREHRRATVARARAARHRARARGPQGVLLAERARESRDGLVPVGGPGAARRGPRQRLRALPGAPRAPHAARRLAVRRRAADARHRPGAHGATRPAAARRAVAGTRATDRRDHLRGDRGQPARAPADHPARRAARRRGARALRSRLRAGDRTGDAGRRARDAPGRPARAARLPGRVIVSRARP